MAVDDTLQSILANLTNNLLITGLPAMIAIAILYIIADFCEGAAMEAADSAVKFSKNLSKDMTKANKDFTKYGKQGAKGAAITAGGLASLFNKTTRGDIGQTFQENTTGKTGLAWLQGVGKSLSQSSGIVAGKGAQNFGDKAELIKNFKENNILTRTLRNTGKFLALEEETGAKGRVYDQAVSLREAAGDDPVKRSEADAFARKNRVALEYLGMSGSEMREFKTKLDTNGNNLYTQQRNNFVNKSRATKLGLDEDKKTVAKRLSILNKYAEYITSTGGVSENAPRNVKDDLQDALSETMENMDADTVNQLLLPKFKAVKEKFASKEMIQRYADSNGVKGSKLEGKFQDLMSNKIGFMSLFDEAGTKKVLEIGDAEKEYNQSIIALASNPEGSNVNLLKNGRVLRDLEREMESRRLSPIEKAEIFKTMNASGVIQTGPQVAADLVDHANQRVSEQNPSKAGVKLGQKILETGSISRKDQGSYIDLARRGIGYSSIEEVKDQNGVVTESTETGFRYKRIQDAGIHTTPVLSYDEENGIVKYAGNNYIDGVVDSQTGKYSSVGLDYNKIATSGGMDTGLTAAYSTAIMSEPSLADEKKNAILYAAKLISQQSNQESREAMAKGLMTDISSLEGANDYTAIRAALLANQDKLLDGVASQFVQNLSLGEKQRAFSSFIQADTNSSKQVRSVLQENALNIVNDTPKDSIYSAYIAQQAGSQTNIAQTQEAKRQSDYLLQIAKSLQDSNSNPRNSISQADLKAIGQASGAAAGAVIGDKLDNLNTSIEGLGAEIGAITATEINSALNKLQAENQNDLSKVIAAMKAQMGLANSPAEKAKAAKLQKAMLNQLLTKSASAQEGHMNTLVNELTSAFEQSQIPNKPSKEQVKQMATNIVERKEYSSDPAIKGVVTSKLTQGSTGASAALSARGEGEKLQKIEGEIKNLNTPSSGNNP
jgi:hypothetical protein